MLPLGKVYASIGAIAAFAEAPNEEPDNYLLRHANGDWGDDRKAYDYALEHGLRVISAYTLSNGERIWIITEADRSITTILLPSEY